MFGVDFYPTKAESLDKMFGDADFNGAIRAIETCIRDLQFVIEELKSMKDENV